MASQHSRDYQPRKGNSIADSLDQDTCRSESWRSNIRATEIVYHTADCDIASTDDCLAQDQRSRIVSRIPHFCSNTEKGRGACIGKYQRTDGGHGVCEAWLFEQLVVRYPDCIFRCSCRSILYTHGDCKDDDYV